MKIGYPYPCLNLTLGRKNSTFRLQSYSEKRMIADGIRKTVLPARDAPIQPGSQNSVLRDIVRSGAFCVTPHLTIPSGCQTCWLKSRHYNKANHPSLPQGSPKIAPYTYG